MFDRPSLRGRLLVMLLPPLCGLSLTLGIGGAWLIGRLVESTSDRVLSGSLQAISETLSVENGHLTLDLPSSALGMLENPDRDNVYYNVSYRGRLVTGYRELSVIDPHSVPLEGISFRYSAFRGMPIRIAAESKLVPQMDSPVVVQVAETISNRKDLANRMMMALAAGEIIILSAVAFLVWIAVGWGLKPLINLRSELETRAANPDTDLRPLPLTRVPTEMTTFVAAFNVLLGHLENAMDTLQRFSGDASHQLRAPLAVLRTHVELLMRQTEESSAIKGTLNDIYLAVNALQHLLMQLISMARAEQQVGSRQNEGTIDLVEISSSIARGHAADALKAGIEISFECLKKKENVVGHTLLVREMITNLIDNAIRYGGAHVTIRICQEPGIIEIEDDGPGIPVSERERVFERFYRLPRNANQQGSGLGLSIVQALARRMGANVILESGRTGRGLRVILRFKTIALENDGLRPIEGAPA
jgi:two-component system sensor histidine kinase TctE